MIFCFWINSLTKIILWVIHVATWCIVSFFFSIVDLYYIIWIYHIVLGCFQFLSIMNNAVINIITQIFLWSCVFISFGQNPKSEFCMQTVCKFMVNVLRITNFSNWFHHFPPAWWEGSHFSLFLPQLLLSVSFWSDILLWFNVHFPNNWWQWVSFYVFSVQVYIFIDELSIPRFFIILLGWDYFYIFKI